jgi:hypothetical protein
VGGKREERERVTCGTYNQVREKKRHVRCVRHGPGKKIILSLL